MKWPLPLVGDSYALPINGMKTIMKCDVEDKNAQIFLLSWKAIRYFVTHCTLGSVHNERLQFE